MAWTYGGWRRETDLTARREQLILHIEEIEAALSGFQKLGALEQQATRFELEELLKRREADLAALEDALGLTPGNAEDQPFVSMRPVE